MKIEEFYWYYLLAITFIQLTYNVGYVLSPHTII